MGEQYASRRQPIEVRSQGLRMSLQTADPVIQIVDRNKQHIGMLACFRTTAGDGDKAGDQ
jgi:hypothetical protein